MSEIAGVDAARRSKALPVDFVSRGRSAFVRMAIGKPARLLPWLREIDTHGDGILCGSGSFEARRILIVLLDNPNARPS